MPKPIDLSNFKVVKTGDIDNERNYINDILHAIVAKQTTAAGVSSINSLHGDLLIASADGSVRVASSGNSIDLSANSGGAGTVTSVGITTGSSGVSVTGSPVTNAGVMNLALGTAAARNVPVSGNASSTQVVLGNDTRLNGITFTDTGISISGGSLSVHASIVGNTIADQVRSQSVGAYAWSTTANWQLWVYPAPVTGTFTLDVRVRPFATNSSNVPVIGDSIVAAAPPSLTANSGHVTSSGSQFTWTGAIAVGDMFEAVPTVNTASVTWWSLFIPARRTF